MELLKQAASQLGVKEIAGEEHNPQIINYAEESGIPGIQDDETYWCSIFINWCAKKAGLPMSGRANARSWLNIGKDIQSPIPGDVVVFWRNDPQSWEGHVGIFLGFHSNATRVFCLGGNQSDAVTIADYDVDKVLGYRRLEKLQALSIPMPVLNKGDKGLEITKLQLVLNHLNYNCGDVDGDFGTKTKDALKLLQANNLLSIDGEYGNKTKDCFESLLQS